MEFPVNLEQLPQMLAFIRDSATQAQLSEERLYRVELASEEALVNVISYAYQQQKKNQTLTIQCHHQKDKRFEIDIRDHGVPFNPLEAEINVDIHQPVEERKIGGLGIFMIRKLIDEAIYQRIGDENVLKLAIRLP